MALVRGLEDLAGAVRKGDTARLPGDVDPTVLGAGLDILRRLHAVLDGHRVGDAPTAIPLAGLDEANLALVDQVLGVGEVSVYVSGAKPAEIDEAVLSGVWRVRPGDGDEHLEVSEFPSLAWRALETGTAPNLPVSEAPEGAMNALAVLVEIRARMAAFKAGETAHVINLTLLPMALIDLAVLDDALGFGPVTALSRGYGDCRIASTSRRHVWRVRHLNADDRLILDTVEIVDIPGGGRAFQEDVDDGARRLGELMGADG
jgi:hydrogenase-1 operon protein HyaF